VGKEALVDDTCSGGIIIIRLIDILYAVISCRAVYLHAFLILTMSRCVGGLCPPTQRDMVEQILI